MDKMKDKYIDIELNKLRKNSKLKISDEDFWIIKTRVKGLKDQFIEEVEKMIDESSEFVYTSFEGSKYINSDGFIFIKQKLEEMKNDNST